VTVHQVKVQLINVGKPVLQSGWFKLDASTTASTAAVTTNNAPASRTPRVEWFTAGFLYWTSSQLGSCAGGKRSSDASQRA
jgi:hypothetical protein